MNTSQDNRVNEPKLLKSKIGRRLLEKVEEIAVQVSGLFDRGKDLKSYEKVIRKLFHKDWNISCLSIKKAGPLYTPTACGKEWFLTMKPVPRLHGPRGPFSRFTTGIRVKCFWMLRVR
jgi:hypothetical protein